jgi:2-dehydropantoate 2-reductase
MKIAVMGAGGMGGYIGGRLAQAGRNVTFIGRRPHLQAIQQNGLQVQSPAGDFLIHPASATDDPAEVGPADLILFCVKSHDVSDAAEMLRPMMKPETVVVPVQNGIDHIEQIGAVLGAEHVLGGVSLIAAEIAAPGIIQHSPAPDTLEFGEIGGGHSSRCELIEKTLAVPGFKASACPNIVERMWWKLAAYSGAGVFCVVRGNRGVLWATPETKGCIVKQSPKPSPLPRPGAFPWQTRFPMNTWPYWTPFRQNGSLPCWLTWNEDIASNWSPCTVPSVVWAEQRAFLRPSTTTSMPV